MKYSPMLFKPFLVHGIDIGIKRKTRRIVDPQPVVTACQQPNTPQVQDMAKAAIQMILDGQCPYGGVGDRIWVREPGWERPPRTSKMLREGADTWERFVYDANGLPDVAGNAWSDDETKAWFKHHGWKRRPSIHMPRWACRFELEIERVEAQPLLDISDWDAVLEGIEPCTHEGEWRDYLSPTVEVRRGFKTPRKSFFSLWDFINGKGSAAKNPWVWAIDFKVVRL
ncbi:hypothetical protein MCEMSHM24_02728 [Comamonadaceae bacterium]